MSKSKTTPILAIHVERLAEMFKALSSPHRLRIFARLAARCCPGTPTTEADMRTCVSNISQNLNLSPSTVSHHMKELRQAGLIKMQKHGQETDCWVEPETLEMLTRFFSDDILQLGRL